MRASNSRREGARGGIQFYGSETARDAIKKGLSLAGEARHLGSPNARTRSSTVQHVRLVAAPALLAPGDRRSVMALASEIDPKSGLLLRGLV